MELLVAFVGSATLSVSAKPWSSASNTYRLRIVVYFAIARLLLASVLPVTLPMFLTPNTMYSSFFTSIAYTWLAVCLPGLLDQAPAPVGRSRHLPSEITDLSSRSSRLVAFGPLRSIGYRLHRCAHADLSLRSRSSSHGRSFHAIAFTLSSWGASPGDSAQHRRSLASRLRQIEPCKRRYRFCLRVDAVFLRCFRLSIPERLLAQPNVDTLS